MKNYEELYTAYEKLWAKFAELYTSTGGNILKNFLVKLDLVYSWCENGRTL
jgi:hypothetical protein